MSSNGPARGRRLRTTAVRELFHDIPGMTRLGWSIIRGATGGPPTGGTMCVVVRADGKVLVVKPRYRRYWCLPGGFLDRAEDPVVGAAREVAEETGARLIGLPLLLATQRRRRHIDYLFSAGLDPEGWEAPTTSWEISAVRWMSPDELQRLHPVSVRAVGLVPGGLPGIVARYR